MTDEQKMEIDGPILKVAEAGSSEDNITIFANRGGGVTIEIEEPWYGDSETGFGKTCSFSLDLVPALKLRDLLNEWLEESSTP